MNGNKIPELITGGPETMDQDWWKGVWHAISVGDLEKILAIQH